MVTVDERTFPKGQSLSLRESLCEGDVPHGIGLRSHVKVGTGKETAGRYERPADLRL